MIHNIYSNLRVDNLEGCSFLPLQSWGILVKLSCSISHKGCSIILYVIFFKYEVGNMEYLYGNLDNIWLVLFFYLCANFKSISWT